MRACVDKYTRVRSHESATPTWSEYHDEWEGGEGPRSNFALLCFVRIPSAFVEDGEGEDVIPEREAVFAVV